MYSLKAEKRDGKIKAKKLRKMGYVPANLYGGNLEHPISFQIPEGEARRLLSEKGKGGQVLIKFEDREERAMIEEISYVVLNDMIEHVSFQCLAAGVEVQATLQVVIVNREHVETAVDQLIEEIPYRALPKNMVEEIEVDVEGKQPGDVINVEDLPVWQDETIEILIPGDRTVVSIAEEMVDLPAADEDDVATSEIESIYV